MNPVPVRSLILFVLLAGAAGCSQTAGVAGDPGGDAFFEVVDFKPVRSEMIRCARYADEVLEVKYTDGAEQRFDGVPDTLAREFFASPGKYGFLLANIKPRYERTILAKSYENRPREREIVQVHSSWLTGSHEVDRIVVVD